MGDIREYFDASCEITIKNLSNHFTIRPEEDTIFEKGDAQGCLIFEWDYENCKIEKLMMNEYKPDLGDKLNMMWIEKLKQVSGWVKGESLYVNIKSNSSGWFGAWYSKNKKDIGSFCDLLIEPSGYVSRRYYNYYVTDQNEEDEIRICVMFRTECIYNNLVCESLQKLKLKK